MKYRNQVNGTTQPVRKIMTGLKALVRNAQPLHVMRGDIKGKARCPSANMSSFSVTSSVPYFQKVVCAECCKPCSSKDGVTVPTGIAFLPWMIVCRVCFASE